MPGFMVWLHLPLGFDEWCIDLDGSGGLHIGRWIGYIYSYGGSSQTDYEDSLPGCQLTITIDPPRSWPVEVMYAT